MGMGRIGGVHEKGKLGGGVHTIRENRNLVAVQGFEPRTLRI
jgi:hypothetical protein